MRDPYTVLGVQKSASKEDLKRAYRKLAKDLHPDLHPGKKDIEDRFKEVSSAYDLLSDDEKRRRYDAGEIDASGAEKPQQRFYRDFAQGGQGAKYQFHAADSGDFANMFGDFFDLGGRGGGRARRGADASYSLQVTFREAALGAAKEIQLPTGQALRVRIPQGVRDGQTIRLAGQGQPGAGGAPAGDALVRIDVQPDPIFTREGLDIHIDLPVSLAEAVLGGKIEVPTLHGPVSLTVPPNSSSGRRLRLQGRGIHLGGGAKGDQYVTLRIVLPDAPDPALEEFVRSWQAAAAGDPRRQFKTHSQ